ncbi:hypothetical protein [Verrucosispora sioxanthis]|uniref:hypothetical protein n=1 Tax=Verrucosispora sioxanthis TaxID=2499994 RepID=UPI001C11F7A1|nr:hypothetical protein [Verrucosispora sioxanthis]
MVCATASAACAAEGGHHRGVAVEEPVGEQVGGADGEHEQQAEYGGGDGGATGQHRSGWQPTGAPGRDEPGDFLFHGEEHADAEGEHDGPEHRQRGVVGGVEVVPGQGEVDVRGQPDHGQSDADADGAGWYETEQATHHRRMRARVSTATARPR